MLPLSHLSFSDSAKYAQAAKNLVKQGRLTVTHNFFNANTIQNYTNGADFPTTFKPLVSYILSLAFRIFPIADLTIALTGITFLILSAATLFLLVRKLSSLTPAVIATLLFLVNPFFLEYALNFSTEILFISEVILFAYLFFSENKKIKLTSLIPLVLMFYTRPHYLILYLALFLYLIYLYAKDLSTNKRLTHTSLILIILTVITYLLKTTGILTYLTSHAGAINILPNRNPGAYIRGSSYGLVNTKQLASKLFYNTYNFLKDPSRLAPAGIFIFFILGFFLKDLPAKVKKFNLFTLITLTPFILSSALTLPNARYVHPVIPLVFISASISMVKIIEKANLKKPNLAISTIAFFILLPSIGHFTLDARFRAQKYNTNKPPVYREISRVMADHVPKDHLIITNLDAWAAWYEGLTTMWFPLKPDMLEGFQDKVDYIVITNYKENDADFALGEWREVVYNPENIENQFLSKNYQVLTTFEINSDQIYENRQFIGTILVSNDQQN